MIDENTNKNISAELVNTDLYIFSYFNNQKKSVPKEAVDYATEKLQSRFTMDRIENFNQKIDVCWVAKFLEFENEIVVKVKLKKNASFASWSQEIPVALVLQSIDRGLWILQIILIHYLNNIL